MSSAYKVQQCGDVCLDACSNIQVRKSQNADSVHLKKGQLSFLLRANKLLLYPRNLWSICKHIETWIKLFWLLSQPKSRLLGLNDSNWELMSESHFNSAETWPNHKPRKPLISSKNNLSLIGPESSIKHHVIWSPWLPLTVSSNTWAAAGRENTCSSAGNETGVPQKIQHRCEQMCAFREEAKVCQKGQRSLYQLSQWSQRLTESPKSWTGQTDIFPIRNQVAVLILFYSHVYWYLLIN